MVISEILGSSSASKFPMTLALSNPDPGLAAEVLCWSQRTQAFVAFLFSLIAIPAVAEVVSL